jgi:flagellar basal-body rod protein FlgB
MTESLFDRGSMPALDALLKYAGARHRAIAGNIANVDTVGYRTLDVPVASFDRAMARAFEDQKSSPTGVFRMKDDLLGLAPSGDAGTLKPGGNNVDLDLEMAKMVRNQSLYATAAALLAQQFSMMREAISGHVTA